MRTWASITSVLLLIAVFAAAGLLTGPAGADRAGSPGPRALNASEVECSTCHDYIRANTTPRRLNISLELLQISPVRLNLTQERFEEVQEAHPRTLDHGNYWCFECHAEIDREKLVLKNETNLQYGPHNSSLLCQQCHAKLYRDWENRIHGRWVGNWSDPEPGQYCVDCHDPHDTHPPFKQIDAEPAPDPPPSHEQSRELLPARYLYIAGIGVVSAVALIGFAAGRRRFGR